MKKRHFLASHSWRDWLLRWGITWNKTQKTLESRAALQLHFFATFCAIYAVWSCGLPTACPMCARGVKWRASYDALLHHGGAVVWILARVKQKQHMLETERVRISLSYNTWVFEEGAFLHTLVDSLHEHWVIHWWLLQYFMSVSSKKRLRCSYRITKPIQ